MNLKRLWFFILITVFIVIVSRSSLAIIDTRAIDNIRDKTTINNGDVKIIDAFFEDAIKELRSTKVDDFSSIAKTRAVILTRIGQGEFAEQYIKSALKHIELGLQQVGRLIPERNFRVTLNLLILMDGLNDTRFVDLAKNYLNDPRPSIRYWAARVLTNDAVISHINKGQGGTSDLTEPIVAALRGQINNGSPEVLGLMVHFVSLVQAVQVQDLLIDIADYRIGLYADWTVQQELLDSHILKQICQRMKTNPSDQGLFGPRFAQLYSYVIQRYIKGFNTLDEMTRRYLVSVIAEIEDQCIGALLGRPQSTLRRAIENNNLTTLLQEHDQLLGNQAKQGQLSAKLGFSYMSQGGSSQAPAVLSTP